MNEGHAGLLALELLRNEPDPATLARAIESVRRRCVFTTHTPVPAGHARFSYELVREVLGEPVPLAQLLGYPFLTTGTAATAASAIDTPPIRAQTVKETRGRRGFSMEQGRISSPLRSLTLVLHVFVRALRHSRVRDDAALFPEHG